MKKPIPNQSGQDIGEPVRQPLAVEFTDIHCHCLPGLDDGPRDAGEALALCRALVADGITAVIATPHALGRYEDDRPAETIRRVTTDLNQMLGDQRVGLRVYSSAEIRLDERICTMLEQDHLPTLADAGGFILLELPHETFIDALPLLKALERLSIRAIISHPERHHYLKRSPQLVEPWVKQGALLQLTAGSLLGSYGAGAERAAWQFLRNSEAVLVATDAHNCQDRPPCMSAAYEILERRLGPAAALWLCRDLPRQVLAGQGEVPAQGAIEKKEETWTNGR